MDMSLILHSELILKLLFFLIGSRSSGSYYDAETSPVSIPNSYAEDSEKTISAGSY